MPKITDTDIEAAEAAVAHARDVRALHARKTPRGSRSRETDIKVALERLRIAMRPVRSYLCGFQYGPQTQPAFERRDRVEAVSQAIQSERRKLWKMKRR